MFYEQGLIITRKKGIFWMTISRTKNYNNLRFYLQRNHKLQNSGALANLLLDKFINAKKPTDYVRIDHSELVLSGVLTKKDRMYDWRELMLQRQILICQANRDERSERTANYKASLFKYGQSIEKYILKGLEEKANVYQRLDLKADEMDVLELAKRVDKKADECDLSALEERMHAKLELAATKEELQDLRLEVADLKGNYEGMILFFVPPDSETRREIVRKYKYDRDKCLEMLKIESEKTKD